MTGLPSSSWILMADIALYTVFFVAILVKMGIPTNLCISYYLLLEKHRLLRFSFPALLFVFCLTIGPIWMKMSNESVIGSQCIGLPFIAFFTLLAVVLSAPYQKSRQLFLFHYSCAIIASACIVLWLFIVALKVIYIGLGILFACLLAGFFTKTLRSCMLFWLETAAIYALSVTLLIIQLFSIPL